MGCDNLWYWHCPVTSSFVRSLPVTVRHLANITPNRALSRSGKKILHVDKNPYYGGPEAALSLQEAEDWALEVNKGVICLCRYSIHLLTAIFTS